ncbi:MAG: cupin domain-containing protein [Ignavibacteriota bacterium]
MNKEAEKIIDALNLTKHPEGGYFSEVYRSDETIEKDLHERFSGKHSLYTSIYFLLSENDYSAFHVLKSDEIWHFYKGTTLDVHIISPDGSLNSISLGKNFESGECFQFCIKTGHYFAAEVRDKSSFALVGCTVSPGFEYSDFELCKKEELSEKFPQHADLITILTK